MTKTNAGVTTKYLDVGLTTTVAATIVGSTITSRATDASGGLLCEWSPDSVSVPIYIGTNGHGDVTWTATPTTIAAGTTTATAAYDPFGKVVSHTGNLPAERWQGSLYDESSGLYYVIARWYGPTIGRFLSVDPVAGNASRPGTLNPYAYGAGDPINSIDPTGQTACGLARDECVQVGHQKVTPRPVAVAVPQRSCGSGPGGCATLIETVRSMGGPGGEAVCSNSAYDFCSTDAIKQRSDEKHDLNVANERDAADKAFAEKVAADVAQTKAMENWPTWSNSPLGRPDCRGNWFCDANNALGTAGDVYGSVVNPLASTLLLAGAVALCAFGGPETLGIGCLPLMGMGIYSAANGANNASKGNYNPVDGWRWQDAVLAGFGTTAFGVLPRLSAGALAVAGSA